MTGEEMRVKKNTLNALENRCEEMREELKDYGFLTVEPVKPMDGDFIQDKPFDVQPVLQRMSIVSSFYDDFKASINATDTSRITDDEMNAFNGIAKAFEDARAVLVGLIG